MYSTGQPASRRSAAGGEMRHRGSAEGEIVRAAAAGGSPHRALEVEVRHRGSGAPIAARVEVARSLTARLRGLLGRRALAPGEGLWLEPCNSIHTFFMAFPIDALFVDRELRVVALYEALPPWRLSRIHRRARAVLELPAGTARASGVQLGDELVLAPGLDAAIRKRPGAPASRPTGRP